MMWVLALACLSLFVACVFEARKGGTSYFAHYILLNLVFIYVVVPVLNNYYYFGRHRYFLAYFNDASSVLYASLLVVLFAFSFYVGFKVSAKNHRFYVWFSGRTERRSYILTIFAIAVLSFILYVYLTDRGWQYVFANASKLRSGTDEAKSYAAAFIKIWTYYIEFVVFYLFAKLGFERRANRVAYLFIFLTVLTLAVLKSFADGGRGGLINLIIGLIFVAAISGRYIKLPKIKILAGICIAIFIGVYGKIYLFQLFKSDALQFYDVSEVAILEQIAIEYSHQFSSLLMAVSLDLGFDRLYMDLVVWIVKPLKLAGIEVPDSISYFNTYYATGVWDSEIPPGLVAFSFYEGGGMGVLVGGLLSGYVVKFIDRLILNTVRQGQTPFSYAFSAILFIYAPFFFLNSDPALFVQWVMAYAALFIFIAFLGGLRLKRLSVDR